MSRYKEIFLGDSLSSKLSLFFNQRSPDENPILLYVLILCLQTRSKPGEKQTLTLDFRKSLLSEIAEVYVCLLRVEPDHVKYVADINGLKMLYAIDLKDPIECMFYSNFFSKLERAILENPAEVQTKLRSAILYQIIASNFTLAE